MKENKNSLQLRMQQYLDRQEKNGVLRSLISVDGRIDFSSNDYLGFAQSTELKSRVEAAYAKIPQLGATGSRLLSGHHPLMQQVEQQVARFHQAETALLFNSGYDANLALLSTLARKSDLIFYDELVHASIHDGMRLSKAQTHAFAHNSAELLDRMLTLFSQKPGERFVVVESVYSMDGDVAPLAAIQEVCERHGAHLLVDEAHATGVVGPGGAGLVQQLNLQDKVFARLHTFSKALGGHGAAVLGSELLRNYLINFARPLIFSTALPMHSIVHIQQAYQLLEKYGTAWQIELQQKNQLFKKLVVNNNIQILNSNTCIQGVMIAGNEAVVDKAISLQKKGFDVRPIRFPTVARGQERLRICLHIFNTKEEVIALVKALQS